MPNFAIIDNGLVQNVIVCDSKEQAEFYTNRECVEFTPSNPAWVGLGWDGTTFEQPVREDDGSQEPQPE